MNTGLPDSDITVLMSLDDEEYPVWPGYHDGETWRTVDDDSPVEGRVIGWLHLHEAAELMDANAWSASSLQGQKGGMNDARQRN